MALFSSGTASAPSIDLPYPMIGRIAVMKSGARIAVWADEGDDKLCFTGQNLATDDASTFWLRSEIIEYEWIRFDAESPTCVRDLIETLQHHPLDRTWEAFGNFIENDDGVARFNGNFATISNVFDVQPRDTSEIEALTAAIRANQMRPDYLSQETHAARMKREGDAQVARDNLRQQERERQARITLGMGA